MQKKIVSAIFETRDQAEKAIGELRDAGIRDELISVVVLHADEGGEDRAAVRTEAVGEHDSKTSGALKGVATGGAVGAIAGLAALAIPGIGPFVAAGAIGEAFGTVGSALLASGAVGATAGGLTGILADYGIDGAEAEEIERRIRRGAALVTVDSRDSTQAYTTARAVLRAAGGETAEPDDALAREHETGAIR